jgi:hypothetical protein
VDLTGDGSGLIDGDEAGVPGGDGEVDEVRLDAGKSMVSSTNSIASRHGAERRLESLRGPTCFGRGRGLRFSAFLVEMVASVRAPEDRKKIRDQREWRSTSQTSESMEYADGLRGFRRVISSALRQCDTSQTYL